VRSRFTVSLFVLLALSGCDRVGRVRECRRLSALVNPKLTRIEGLAKKGTAPDYRAAAQTYAALAKETRSAMVRSPNGKALADEYAGLLESVAPAVSAYAVALEAKDARGMEETRRSLDRLSKHEHGLVARIDAYCVAP
jgi:hypothetical protein